MTKADDPKPDDSQRMPHGNGELERAYERIKSAGEELTRLDRLVSGLERGDDPAVRNEGAAQKGEAAVKEAPAAEKPTPDSPAADAAPLPDQKASRPMLRGLVALLLALGIFGAAFASRYGDGAKAIMARWAPQASVAPPAAAEQREPAQSLMVQVADAAQQPPPASPPGQQPPAAAQPTAAPSPAAEATSADVAQSLKAIASDLAGINDKLEQLKASHEQTLREHADSIQQLKTAQQQNAKDSARLVEQVQALQTQLSALSAKAAAPSVKKENEATPRQRIPVAEPRRPRRPRAPWMPAPDMVEPWDDPYW